MAEKSTALPGTRLLEEHGVIGEQMLSGLSHLLDREIASVDGRRTANLMRPSCPEERARKAALKRRDLARCAGVVDNRLPIRDLELVASVSRPALVAETSAYDILAVRWPVLPGVDGEGLLLRPNRIPLAYAIAVPDADWTPEMIAGISPELGPEAQYARRLAELGCQVIVPMLIDRSCRWSGNPAIRMTNQPHREFVYRMAYQMGRHIIGYEVQKVLSLVDFYAAKQEQAPIIVFGYGEGGLLALYSAVLDLRISGAGISGYFRNRSCVWQEPIYRNVWRLLCGLSDAELAASMAPRPLVVEAHPGPILKGPPPSTADRNGAAPGLLCPVPVAEVRAEVGLALQAYKDCGAPGNLVLIEPENARSVGSDAALTALLRACGLPMAQPGDRGPAPWVLQVCDPEARLKRQFDQLCGYTQQLWRHSAKQRASFWKDADSTSIATWVKTVEWYRSYFRSEVIGQAPEPNPTLNPRSRLVESTEQYEVYEVVIEVWDEVPAFAYLLVPNGIAPQEKRPAIVCQHGLGGDPKATLKQGAYRALARRLAAHGYVVLAPQNPTIGPAGDAFRVLQRKANPLGLSLFSFITAIHEKWLAWLSEFSFVDAKRIAFYGLSYGGKAALRVPALLQGYALSICSGDFNEWVMKTTCVDFPTSYMFTGEYEIFEFGLGETFNHAEMAYLIAPRPFMVERGHRDPCGTDDWVAFEYAKVRYLYNQMDIGEHTGIEFFSGGHEIHFEGTLDFLRRHFQHPA